MTLKHPRLLCADLFAGAGGLSAGLHNAGFETVFFNEMDEAASLTYQANFPTARPYVCPVEEVSADMILADTGLKKGELDLLVGGPPCQGFSINAPARSKGDERNHLFRHYLRLVCEGLHPKFLILENVPGLLSMEDGATISDVMEAFGQAGYRASFKVLNAAHYGVPQERWRLIILATSLEGFDLEFPTPRHFSRQRANFRGGREHSFYDAIQSSSNPSPSLGESLLDPISIIEAIGDLPPIQSGGGVEIGKYSKKAGTVYQKMIRKGSRTLHNHTCGGLGARNLERMAHVPQGGSWRDIPFELLPEGMKRARRSDHTKRYGRLDPDGMSGTIMTKCDPHWGTVVHYEQDRILSARECARIQSFPDKFHFTGKRADQYRQIGNAVPPLLGEALAQSVKSMLVSANRESLCQGR